ncbi:MAG: hypothetical protein H0W89_06215 [Candidatus Levybacteria bacterium]|nr:hypothetical protein [Candidatus Levybacteria bacterium]
MNERLALGNIPKSEIGWSQKLHTAMNIQDRKGFDHLMDDVLPHISPELLLHDFAAQIKLRNILVDFRHATQRRKDPAIIELHATGSNHAGTPGYSSSARERMILRDKDHIYFFANDVQRTHSDSNGLHVAPYIQSAVSIETTQLSRVSTGPGSVEVYNYEKGTWQPNGRQEHRGVAVGNRRMNGVRLQRVYGGIPTSH